MLDTHFAAYALPARAIGRRKRRAHVVHFQGPWAQESAVSGQGRPATDVKRLIERLTYSGADGFIVLSEDFKNVLSSDYAVDPQLVHVIPPGVDTQRFKDVATTPQPRKDIVTVRRLERRMGIDVLLRAWAQVESSYPNNRLVVVGDGSEASVLRQQANDLGIGHRVLFTGRLTESALVHQYQTSILSVVPSTALEGFGLIALESMACGTPVIVTDCGGLPNAVRDLDVSLVVPSGDASALAARLASALSGAIPNRSASRRHAEGFSWQTTARRHLDLYTTLLHRG